MRFWPFQRKANEDGSIRHSADLFAHVYGAMSAKSGASVTHASALEVSCVFAAVRVIAEGIAQVPCKVYRQDGVNTLPATDHPLYRRLHRKPNGWMSSFDLRETMAIHALLTGNAIAYVGRDMKGDIRELIPIKPGDVTIKQARDYSLTYEIKAPNGATQPFPQSAIWHWRGPSWDGVAGLDVVKYAREAIGLAMVTEESHSKMHANGTRIAGTYSVEGNLSKEQHKQLRDWIASEYGGAANAGKPMILDRAAKFLPSGMTGIDAQHLETRRYQIEEICRAFRVMPIMVGYSDKAATYASAEQMFLAHVVHTLSPWYERIEQSADCQLLSDKEAEDGLFVKFNAAGLLRGSHKDRSEYFAKALGSGGSPAWMTVDEIRALEELNPMGGEASKLPARSGAPEPQEPPAEGDEDGKA
ncbi:MAG: phage portal protein [Sulfuricaulis sp.]|nr:phage portal protein [Sulfuricaulis sp.]